MGVLDSHRVNRAIRVLLSDEDVPAAEQQQALATLKQFAGHAVPKLIAALPDSRTPAKIAELLVPLLNNGTLSLFLVGLFSPDTRVASRVMEVLHGGRNYDPNQLLDLFQDPDVPKGRLVEVLVRQKHALDAYAVLRLLDTVDKESRTMALRLADEVATDSLVPELISRLEGGDWLTRLSIARTLRRFSTDASRDALTKLLGDQHKTVRQAALDGLAAMRIPVEVKAVCERLRDPDLTVQAKAIEDLTKRGVVFHVCHHAMDLLGVKESELQPTADGRLIVFSVARLRDKEVFVANADGSGAIPVSRSDRKDSFGAWRPGTGPDQG